MKVRMGQSNDDETVLSCYPTCTCLQDSSDDLQAFVASLMAVIVVVFLKAVPFPVVEADYGVRIISLYFDSDVVLVSPRIEANSSSASNSDMSALRTHHLHHLYIERRFLLVPDKHYF